MLNAYPRPQMRRDSFFNLNGEWDFAITDGQRPDAFAHSIEVPYPPESARSGICRRIEAHEVMWYRKTFTLPDGFNRGRMLLHFGAVDQIASVYWNGTKLGTHEGGYLPFSFDVTAHLAAQNELIVEARDALDHRYPWGKQKRSNGGMWYTPFSGIWQTVWLESVPEPYISDLVLTPSLDAVTVEVRSSAPAASRIAVETPSGVIEASCDGSPVRIPIPDPILWTPEHPHLYPLTVRVGSDTVHSYFALRTFGTGTVDGIPRLLLNGEPVFLHGVLDQGYWPEGICLPPDDGGYERDILALKTLGFNTIRKHIRVEPLPFYEACDRLGMLVLQDFVNNGDYRFLHDTVLPTIGLKTLSDARTNRDPITRRIFLDSAKGTISHLYNAPCVIGWTIFNEGWGQFCANEVYHTLKPLDPTRIFDATSGWFFEGESDVQSEHVYFKPFRPRFGKKPYLLSEFGGYVYTTDAGKKYGYRFFTDPDAYRDALETLYRREILPAVERGLCGAIYTQLSDVEQERNGLLSYDRSITKANATAMQAIAKQLQLAVRQQSR